MNSKIEKMNKMRRIVLKGMLAGWITLGIYLFHIPLLSLMRISSRKIAVYTNDVRPFLEASWIVGFVVLAVYIVIFLVYKIRLLKDSSVRSAVNDERVKLNWLRSYRIAFFTLLGITIFWKWFETGLGTNFLHMKIRLVEPPWIIWFSSILALIVSFLHYDRGVRE